MPIGILFEGNPNGSRIIGGGINNCTTALKIQDQSGGDGRIANGIVVDGVSFEGYGTAVHVLSATASATIAGLRFINNRFENGTTVFSFTGITAQPAVWPWLAGNMLVSNAGTYLNNPESLEICSFDFSATPDIGVPVLRRGINIHALDGSDEPLTLLPLGGNRGLSVKRPSDEAKVVSVAFSSTGDATGRIQGRTHSELAIRGVIGLGGSAASDAQNFRGSATFATAATVAVSFGTAEPDASYYVIVTGDVNETFWITSKATGGFTINSSNGSSTATVDWMLIR
jgi:hypothetical protein